MSPQSISNAERGRQDPSLPTLEKLSQTLNFPVAFFRATDLEELKDDQVSFRARSKTSARAKAAVRSAARIAVELSEWIDRRFVAPPVAIPSLGSQMTPELAAEHVRARWGLDSTQSVPNAVHLLESKGVAVFSLPPDYRDVDAFSFWWRNRPFVMLSTTKSAERSRFDALHELGHLVMHRGDRSLHDWRAAETEANRFASAFLMPKLSVFHHVTRPITTDRIITVKARWRVAAMALAYRLHELDLLSEWNYRQVIIELGRLGYRTGEPSGIVRESSQFLAKVLKGLREDGISFSSLANELHVDPDELRHLTFGLVVRSAGEEPVFSSNARHVGIRDLRLVDARGDRNPSLRNSN